VLPAGDAALVDSSSSAVVLMQLLTQVMQREVLIRAEMMAKTVLVDVRHFAQYPLPIKHIQQLLMLTITVT